LVLGGPPRHDVLARALALRDALLCAGPAHEPVCLAADERSVVALALLASLAGGPPLVVPHDGTPEALRAACETVPFARAIGGVASALPRGVRGVRVPAMGARGVFRLARGLDLPFLHLHTGGSTGRPRAWAKTPRNLLAEAVLHSRRHGFGPADRIVATVSPRHIYGMLFSVVVPLVSGAAVLGPTPFFPAAIGATLARERATVLVTVPAHARALGRASWRGAVRLALSSTAPLAAEDAARFAERARIGIEEVFGSTETGGIATRRRVSGKESWTVLEGVRWGASRGRLRVASPFLSPELPRDRNGFFATADRVTRAAGGFVLLGRADGIVKVGGRRVDTAEVEARLRALAGVEDAWVWSRAAAGGRGAEVVALVTGPAAPERIRSALRRLLPPEAWPRRLRRVARLPATATGKRDRAAAEALLEGGAEP
jgi:acyl-coenzyme A synthetase/AMP-(fatty) acid ligase